MSEPNHEKCAVCGKKLKRGERRACRSCVVAVATMRAARNPGGDDCCNCHSDVCSEAEALERRTMHHDF